MATKVIDPTGRRAKRLAEEAEIRRQYELNEAEHIAMYKATIPKRLMDAQAMACHLGVSTHVSLTETGPSVRFECEDHTNKIYIDDIITYNTEEWELESLERKLNELKKAQDEYNDRRIVANMVWDKLTPDQKHAIKEQIAYLKV